MTSLFVYEDWRNRGIATALLWKLYDYYIQKTSENEISFITWSDCSDECLKPDNLYIKLGAFYKEPNDPEMIWDIHSNNVKKRRQMYTYPPNLVFSFLS
jgi:GNAT superfamily N-acetyltransferase